VAKQTETATNTIENSKYLPSRGSVREVAGITSITRVKYSVCDTRMAIAKAVF
jgi:hypothetical protein